MRGSRYFSMRSRIVAVSAVVGVCSVYGAQTVLAAPSAGQTGSVRLIVQTKSGLTMADQHGVIARSHGGAPTNGSGASESPGAAELARPASNGA